MSKSHDPTIIPPGLRNLQVLEVFAQAARPMTATEINALLGLPKPTIHRLVSNLEQEGYLSRQLDGRSYLPGPRLRSMMLGVMRAGQFDLARHDILLRLCDKIGETCSITIPEGDSLVYVDRAETHWPLRLVIELGTRIPLHATAAGKVCLAYMNPGALEHFLQNARLEALTEHTITTAAALQGELHRIREQGHATDNEEFIPDMVGASVPVLDAGGRLIAVLTFHAPTKRMPMSQVLANVPHLHVAATELAELA